jgi:hypothetical protein
MREEAYGPANDFDACLAASHAAEDWPGWERIYRQAFPDFDYMRDHRLDGYHQREGIDRSVITKHAKHILIDEKVRMRNKLTGKVYPDIALEVWSNVEGKVPGWVSKPLRADYIAYAILPLGVCYLLPVPQLQAVWIAHEDEWTRWYKMITAKSKKRSGDRLREWSTQSVCVPASVVLDAIKDTLTVRFDPVG